MFTGIITDIGTIRAADPRGDLRLTIGCRYDLASVEMGASIACSGACLTVVDKGDDWFAVDLSAESIRRTAIGMWEVGKSLNLERALRLGDELGGHLVTGHIDGVATIAGTLPEGDSMRIDLSVPGDLGRFIAAKGSITLDGASLTVNDVSDEGESTRFAVNVIPHTASHTTLGSWAPNQQVNVEIDLIARYMQRLAEREKR